jgi:glycosyltransferase involved in cell wall biosynthesis
MQNRMNISEKIPVDQALSKLINSPKKDNQLTFDTIVQSYDLIDIIETLYEKYPYSNELIIEAIRNSSSLRVKKRKIRTIGIMYKTLKNGGAERVIANLTPLLIQRNYQIVLLTDYPPTADDYQIPSSVPRFTIGDWNDMRKRYTNLTLALTKYQIDVLIHNDFWTATLLWDIIAAQISNTPIVLHFHNVFSRTLISGGFHWVTSLMTTLSLANHVVCLSNIDQKWFSLFGIQATQINNPSARKGQSDITPDTLYDNKTLLWVGRINPVKHPLDAIEVFHLVQQKIPESRLIIVGDYTNNELYPQIQSLVSQYQLNESVHFAGYHTDISDYYSNAKVFLSTSEVEGWGLTLTEAMSYGLPITMYDLPYLEFLSNPIYPQPGILCSPQPEIDNRRPAIEKMAQNIITLLTDDALWQEYHQRQLACDAFLRKIDIGKAWDKLFKNLHKLDTNRSYTPNLMIQTLLTHMKIGAQRIASKDNS